MSRRGEAVRAGSDYRDIDTLHAEEVYLIAAATIRESALRRFPERDRGPPSVAFAHSHRPRGPDFAAFRTH
jgi:hypothetical protein